MSTTAATATIERRLTFCGQSRRYGASVPVGFFLMFPLATLFDAMNWPGFHTWGLAHGFWLFAWPMLTLLSLPCLLLVDHIWRRQSASRNFA